VARVSERLAVLDRRRLLVAAALWGLVVLVLIVTFRPERDFALWRTVFDAAHLPVFGVMGWATIWAFRERGWPQTLLSIVFVALLAAGTEGGQLFTGRDATAADLAWNLAGGAIGVALGRAWLGARTGARPSPVAAGAFGTLALGLLAVATAPAAREIRALDHFRRALPSLGDFEDPIEMVWWRKSGGSRIARTSEAAGRGRFALRVDTGLGRYPGAAIERRSFDWADFDTLSLWVENPGPEFPLILRIDDDRKSTRYEDRFNGRFVVPPGESVVTIPLARIANGPRDRRLRLSSIRSIYVFVDGTVAPEYFLIDDVRLSRAAESARDP
jgi:hypothetical protein